LADFTDHPRHRKLTRASLRDLIQRASANLKTAKTTHIDGTGAFALKDGMSFVGACGGTER